MSQLIILMISEEILSSNLTLADFKEQDEPFERIISKLENNRKVNLEFSLVVKNKLNNNQEKHKLGNVLVVVWLK